MVEIEQAECRAFGLSPLDALATGMRESAAAMVIYDTHDYSALAMLGCGMVTSPTLAGVPWALSTNRAKQFPRAWMWWGRRFTQAYLGTYGLLANVVHRDNHVSIRWLEAIGYYVDETVIDVGGEPFHQFWCCLDPALEQMLRNDRKAHEPVAAGREA